MTSFHLRGFQAVHARSSRVKGQGVTAILFRKDLRQGFQWVSKQLMLINRNLMCTCLGRLALFSRPITEQTFPKAHSATCMSNFSGGGGKVNKKCSFLSPLLLLLPLCRGRASPLGAASSYLNLGEAG